MTKRLLILAAAACWACAAAVLAVNTVTAAGDEERSPASKPAPPPRPPALSEEQEKELLSMLKEKRPDDYSWLLKLRDDEPGRYRRLMGEAWRVYERVRNMPPELRKLTEAAQQARIKAWRLSRELRSAADDAQKQRIRDELLEALQSEFNTEQQIREFHLAQLQEQIKQLGTEVKDRAQQRQHVIEERLNNLLSAQHPDRPPRMDRPPRPEGPLRPATGEQARHGPQPARGPGKQARRMNQPFRIFASEVVDRVRSTGNVWRLPGGQLILPRVFGFCRGVTRAMAMLQEALHADAGKGTRFFLLGQIIHNPWVNRYFEGRGVQILDPSQIQRLDEIIGPDNCGVIPAFGVPLEIEDRLRAVGCRIVDTTCGDVRRLWEWARHAVEEGFGVLIYGRARHDETVVTKSRLDAVGGKYLVVGDLEQAERFCRLIGAGDDSVRPAEVFGRQASNADSLQPFLKLAQVSQTTMLHDETMQVRDLVREAFERRFASQAAGRLLFQPTVCRATQQRQAAAMELCQAGCDLVLVVGGFGSSNTRHLYELARSRGQACFIEDASGIVDSCLLQSYDPLSDSPAQVRDWLPARRPLKIGILAGASSPEIVVGEVLQRMASLLTGP